LHVFHWQLFFPSYSGKSASVREESCLSGAVFVQSVQLWQLPAS